MPETLDVQIVAIRCRLEATFDDASIAFGCHAAPSAATAATSTHASASSTPGPLAARRTSPRVAEPSAISTALRVR